LSITEFKRCYLLKCYELGLKTNIQVLEYLSNLEFPSRQFHSDYLNLYGYSLDDEALIPLLSSLAVRFTNSELLVLQAHRPSRQPTS
jgi:hypothetical protein